MKIKSTLTFIALVLLSTLSLQPATVFAQGTAFTYQGRLNASTNPANGTYNLRFALFDALTVGNQVGSPLTNAPVSVSNGLFTVTLDFGANFPGANRWLEIGVRTNGSGTFSTLSPRQKITPSPYAIYAAGASAAGISGTIPTANLTGTYGSAVTFNNAANSFSGNGTGLNNVNAISLGGLGAASFWVLGGNAVTGGANLGTGDNQPLNLISWNSRVLRLETKKVSLGGFDSLIAVNTLGGASGNVISNGVMGGTIAGGGAETNHLFGSEAAPNTVLDNFGTVGGGLNNTAGYASADFDDARAATVAGGENNAAGNEWAAVGGGRFNTASGTFATVGGGYSNRIGNYNSNSTISGGSENFIEPNVSYATIGGGIGNLIQGYTDASTVVGGYFNAILAGAYSSTIGGGEGNLIHTNALNSTIGGGAQNTIVDYAQLSTIGGGYNNVIQFDALAATIPGGSDNTAAGDYSFAAGRRAQANHSGTFVWADSTDADFASTAANQFAIRASGGVRLSDSTPNLSFGSTTRQMLNLWGTQYGIGVQTATVYFRCDNADANDGFIWYRGGVHNDGYANPGGGGTEMMHLVSSGLYVNGAIVLTSDRNAKENFTLVSPREVLEKVVALPISRWNFKEDKASEHLGPMAQDFRAAFGLGPDDKHITTVDADGVALAAIQGLNQKLNEKDAEIQQLKQRLDKLETLISNSTDKQNGGEK
jgi:hypothetical protein